jgi:hypothetical protein
MEEDLPTLRQVVLVATDIDRAAADVGSALDVSPCFRDPSVAEFGLQNVLFSVGDRFIEIVSPIRDGTAAGRHLSRRGGDGGYMLMVEVSDLAAQREHLDAMEVRLVWEGRYYDVSGMHLHPADIGGAILSMDQPEPPGSWGWAGTEWSSRAQGGVATRIVAAELQAADTRALAERWAAVLQTVAQRGPGAEDWALPLKESEIRVTPDRDGRGDGLRGFDVVAADRSRAGERLAVAGVEIQLV